MYDNPSIARRLTWLRQQTINFSMEDENNLSLPNNLIYSILTGPCKEKKWVDEVKKFILRHLEIITSEDKNKKQIMNNVLESFKKTILESKSYWKYQDTRIVSVDIIANILKSLCVSNKQTDQLDPILQFTNIINEFVLLLGETIEYYFTTDIWNPICASSTLLSSHTNNNTKIVLTSTSVTSDMELYKYMSLLKSISIRNNELFQVIMTEWLKTEFLLSLSLISTVLASTDQSSKSEQQQQQLQILINDKVIDLYTKRILLNKTMISNQSSSLRLLQPFFSTLHPVAWNTPTATPTTVAACLETILLQALKKTPEGSARYVSVLISQLPLPCIQNISIFPPSTTSTTMATPSMTAIDLNSFIIQGGCTSALRMIKSTSSAAMRYYGVYLCYHMSLRCTSYESYVCLIKTLLDAVQGKGGFVSLATQRIYIYLSLCYIAHQLPLLLRVYQLKSDNSDITCLSFQLMRDLDTCLNQEILPILLTYLEKEADETVKVYIMKTITVFLHIWIHSHSTIMTTTTISGSSTTTAFISFQIPTLLLEAAKTSITKNKPTCLYFLTILVSISRQLQSQTPLSTSTNSTNTTNIKMLEMIKSLCQGLEPLVASLITMTKESLKKPLAVQPDAVLAYELLLHLGYFAAAITTLNASPSTITNDMLSNIIDKALVTLAVNIITNITTAKLWVAAGTSATAPMHSVNLLQSIGLSGFKSASNNNSSNNQEEGRGNIHMLHLNDIEVGRNGATNTNITASNITNTTEPSTAYTTTTTGLGRLMVYTDIHSITGYDSSYEDLVEKEVVLVNGVQAYTEAIVQGILSILMLSATLQPACFACLYEYSSQVLITNDDANSANSTPLTATTNNNAGIIHSIMFLLTHPSLYARKESSRQLKLLYSHLQHPVPLAIQSLFTTAASTPTAMLGTGKKGAATLVMDSSSLPTKSSPSTTAGSVPLTSVNNKSGLMISRSLCLQLLQHFYEDIVSTSVSQDTHNTIAMKAGISSSSSSTTSGKTEITTGMTSSTVTHDDSSHKKSIKVPSPSTLLSVLITCLTPVFSAISPTPLSKTSDATTTDGDSICTLISKLQTLSVVNNTDNTNTTNNNVKDDADMNLLSSYISRIMFYILFTLGHPYLGLNPALGSLSTDTVGGKDASTIDTNKNKNSCRITHILNIITSILLNTTAGSNKKTLSPIDTNTTNTTAQSTATSTATTGHYQLSDVLLCLNEVSRNHLCQLIIQTLYHSQSNLIRQTGQNIIILLIQHTYASPTTNTNTNIQQLNIGHEIVLTNILPHLLSVLEASEYKSLPNDDLFKYLCPQKAKEEYIAKTEVKDDEVKITNADRMKDSSRASRRGEL